LPASARVFWVKPDDVESQWHLGRYWIEAACKRGPGRIDPNALKAACASGASQYFVVLIDGECVGALVTTITIDWPTGHKTLEWTALGGKDREKWFELERIVIRAAREHGCMAMRSYSRPGMARVLKRRGYCVVGVILEKEIV